MGVTHDAIARASQAALTAVPCPPGYGVTYAGAVAQARAARAELVAAGATRGELEDFARAFIVVALTSSPDDPELTPARRRQFAAALAEAFGYRAALLDDGSVQLTPREDR